MPIGNLGINMAVYLKAWPSLYRTIILGFALIWQMSCHSEKKPLENAVAKSLDVLAEDYVKLVLQIGQYDPDFVDAYYGPAEWLPKLKPSPGDSLPHQFTLETNDLINQLDAFPIPDTNLEIARLQMLRKQCKAVATKLLMMKGQKFTFDEEAELLYDATPPHFDTLYFNQLLADLDKLVPGSGNLSQRYADFSRHLVIPVEKLDTVFQVAINEARLRTKKHFELPENENFEIEYVTGKSWSGYNYYKGNSYSLIQINIDLPIYIERAIDLACHEGYPGHHVFNTLLEKNLVNEKGWMEFSVYPLFSPQSFIAEGSANYGIDLAFPGDEKLKYEKEVLYPLAGLDTSLANVYDQIQLLRTQLNYAGNEAARAYLNGEIDRENAASMLEKYLLYEPDRALQRTRFFDQYRSYVINYNLGEDMIANYIRQEAGMDMKKRWSVFGKLVSSPVFATMLEE